MASNGLGEDGRSPLTAQALGAMWPEVRTRLQRSLRRTGAGADAVDEALAEAATRALSRRLPVASPDDFCRWAFVVARNLLVEATRSGQRLVSVPELPERGDGFDVGEHVASRQQLRATVRAFVGLSDADQEAIRSAIAPSPVPGRGVLEATRMAVRRHRARARLRAVVGAPAALWIRARPLPWPSTPAGRVVAAGSLTAPLLFVTTALILFPPSGEPARAGAPARLSAPIETPLPPPAADRDLAPPSGSTVVHRATVATTASSPGPTPAAPAPTARQGAKGGVHDSIIDDGGEDDGRKQPLPIKVEVDVPKLPVP